MTLTRNHRLLVPIAFTLMLRWQVHPERVNNMKNLSASELSRRRLVPAKKPRKTAEPSPAAQSGDAKDGESSEAVAVPKKD